MCADPAVSNGEQQENLELEQSYTFGKTTFIVESRFRSEGIETLGSVLVKLMQNDVDD